MTYRLTVRVASKWLSNFRRAGLNLCCSFGVKCNGSEVEFNVIAWAETPTPINTIAFTDNWFIAACKHGIEDGAFVAPNTDPIPMQLGQAFTVQKDWTSARTSSSHTSVPNAIHFLPSTTASAVLMKHVRNVVTPFYVASMGAEPFPPGNYTLVPSGNVCIFFMAQEGMTAFKMTKVPTQSYLFRYDGQNPTTIIYNEDGDWELQTPVPLDNLPVAGTPSSMSANSSPKLLMSSLEQSLRPETERRRQKTI